jgi:hypothetical protein
VHTSTKTHIKTGFWYKNRAVHSSIKTHKKTGIWCKNRAIHTSIKTHKKTGIWYKNRAGSVHCSVFVSECCLLMCFCWNVYCSVFASECSLLIYFVEVCTALVWYLLVFTINLLNNYFHDLALSFFVLRISFILMIVIGCKIIRCILKHICDSRERKFILSFGKNWKICSRKRHYRITVTSSIIVISRI